MIKKRRELGVNVDRENIFFYKGFKNLLVFLELIYRNCI